MIKQQDVKNGKVSMSSAKNNDLIGRLKNISAAVDAANDLAASQKDEFYKDLPNRIDTILGEDTHLHKLKQLADARQAFIKEHNLNSRLSLPPEKFRDWLSDRWGIELRFSESIPGEFGMSGYSVVDEQKYLLFCMVFP